MNRSILCSLVVAAALSVVALSADDPKTSGPASKAPAGRPAPVVDVSCKPLAPIDVSLIQTDGAGPFVELAFTLRPLRELREVTWELELPADASLLEGSRLGEAAGTRGVETRGLTRLSLPADDSYRRARLTVRAVMTGSDEFGDTFDEPIAVSRTLGWGTPEPVGAVVLTPDAETGEAEQVVVLRTAHRPGR